MLIIYLLIEAIEKLPFEFNFQMGVSLPLSSFGRVNV